VDDRDVEESALNCCPQTSELERALIEKIILPSCPTSVSQLSIFDVKSKTSSQPV